MGRFSRPEIGQVEHIGHEKSNDKDAQPLQGGHDHVSEAQVPLLGHGEALEA